MRQNLAKKGMIKNETHSYLIEKNRQSGGIKLIDLNIRNTNMTDDSAKLLLDLMLEG